MCKDMCHGSSSISIHTTTQVVTLECFLFGGYLCYFNPHHHAGGDLRCYPLNWSHIDFNPHHHAGGDLITLIRVSSFIYFNPHHHAGGDILFLFLFCFFTDFNPHHHAGGDGIIMNYPALQNISIHTTTQVVTANRI